MDQEQMFVQQSQTRSRYDPFHQVDDMRITSYALRYYTNTPAANCPTVFPVEPTTRMQYTGNSWKSGQWKTDIESDLKGINRLGTRVKCDDILYNPETNKMNGTPQQNPEDASNPLTFNRLYNPPCTLRATGWNRWQPLFHQPQETFETPFDTFVPSRWNDRDACTKRYVSPLQVNTSSE